MKIRTLADGPGFATGATSNLGISTTSYSFSSGFRPTTIPPPRSETYAPDGASPPAGEMYAAQHASQEHATEARRGLAGAVASDAGVAVAVVRLRGAPFDVARAEIAALFGAHGVEEHSVFLAPRVADGKPSGEAFVAVARGEAAAEDAIRTLDRKEIRGRWVELFAATPAELAARCKAGLAAAHRPDAADRGVVRVGGLPFVATRADVARLFEAGRAALAASLGAEGSCVALRDEAGIFLPSTPDRRPSGLAFLVVAGGADAAALATRALDGASLGDRAVVAAPATMCELYAALGDDALESRCALLRGLPFSFCGPGQGRKRVIQDRFNTSVPRAIVPGKASTRRERSER